MNSLSQMQMLEKYNCEKCRFSTKDPNKYNIHIALHNEMKYVCSHCNFESYTKSEFQRHLVSHSGKFPYTCEYCGYGAIRNDYIVKHIKRIHGDGKIPCSVSTLENDSKNTSVNIVQTQIRNGLQEILPNNTNLIAKNLLDLPSEVDNAMFNNGSHLNRNNNPNADQVEVEVISPTDQQLCPWMPLTVVAPPSFRVPDICFAQVVEVKPANGTCYLVLKCLEVTDLNGTKIYPPKEKNVPEQNAPGPIVRLENRIGSSNGSSLPLCGTESLLATKNTVALIHENPPSLTSQPNGLTSQPNGLTSQPNGLTSQPNNEIINALDEVTNDLFDETEISDGPIISSVFSLSSGSQNAIEGIQWESPIVVTNTNASKNIVDTTLSFNGMEGQGGPKVLDEAKSQVEIEAFREQRAVLESELPETNKMEVKNTGSEIQLPPNQPVLPYIKNIESQTFAFTLNNQIGGRKVKRLSTKETNLFSNPQTLFLSYDKRIVMQPLSYVMQTWHRVSRENELVQLKVKSQSVKPKRKILTKRFAAPALKTLRLCPVKANQLTKMPHKNQPVVVLNHPEMESIEASSIMKAISLFKGMVLKVSLSKQTRRKII
ncbi:zinc finger protein 518B [Rana temporaria]|uniref:zinc finger protein 518B n=1 Tax=Rana temporaria TaxID=8407 RepID=UPI001AAC63A9|nr:zinc finger protein 518B [Rana temporaria]